MALYELTLLCLKFHIDTLAYSFFFCMFQNIPGDFFVSTVSILQVSRWFSSCSSWCTASLCWLLPGLHSSSCLDRIETRRENSAYVS